VNDTENIGPRLCKKYDTRIADNTNNASSIYCGDTRGLSIKPVNQTRQSTVNHCNSTHHRVVDQASPTLTPPPKIHPYFNSSQEASPNLTPPFF
jgi:hypothetical protein